VFTGIVEAVGRIEQIESFGPAVRIKLRCAEIAEGAKIGDSIALNGCCLTVVAVQRELLEFDAGEETLLKTNLGQFVSGTLVNLERSLLASSRLGGHFVTGHVDCTGTVRSRVDQADWSTIWFEVPSAWTRLLAPKGSVAVDGISLTLVDVTDDAFSVAFIPHTLEVTMMGERTTGDRVNIETDVLAKYIQQMISREQADDQSSVDESQRA
jgi:riboflavin synthase